MNISKNILVGIAISLGLASCVNEEFPTSSSRQGSMTLNIDKVAPAVVRSVETDDYPVTIYSMTENKEIASYERADQVPSQIKLAVGNYYAEAHTPGQLEKIMETPYYAGRDEFEILQNINTISTVVCRMANGRIHVNYSDDFTQAFADWTVTVTDGDESAIIYTYEKDGLNPTPLYINWKENVKELKVNFVGTTLSGNRITTNSTLTKQQASEQYDSDTEYFAGGDCIVINFKPVESTEGDITGITIKANIQFEESEEGFDMEVEDYIPENPDSGDDSGDNPGGGDSNAITLTLPEDMIVSALTDPALGDTYIAAEHGIKSIMVKMVSTSDAMMGSLADLAGNYDGVDFVAGAEVVENQEMVRLFGDLGQTLAVPSTGDTEYVFPIGNFFSLLAFLPGEHSFTLVITDMEGNTKNGELTLTVE